MIVTGSQKKIVSYKNFTTFTSLITLKFSETLFPLEKECRISWFSACSSNPPKIKDRKKKAINDTLFLSHSSFTSAELFWDLKEYWCFLLTSHCYFSFWKHLPRSNQMWDLLITNVDRKMNDNSRETLPFQRHRAIFTDIFCCGNIDKSLHLKVRNERYDWTLTVHAKAPTQQGLWYFDHH